MRTKKRKKLISAILSKAVPSTCERCENNFPEDEINETSFKDADGDKQNQFICDGCVEKIYEGDV